MPDIVIVTYRPKLRRADALGRVTDRAPVSLRAADGTVVALLERRDGATARAHDGPEVQPLRAEFAEVRGDLPRARGGEPP